MKTIKVAYVRQGQGGDGERSSQPGGKVGQPRPVVFERELTQKQLTSLAAAAAQRAIH